ncbi:ABC transporter ATP-binding protein [Microbacterium sp. zg.B48]|uniref:ABC transporter ATP-binding protein n=1 Tax=unclassified Microbacterium TaxID=2609290 RepID=UPI00214C1C85|nr:MULTISPECIES: ABC transporter ATP-binding protein [unclassified Microbacterium]MCR2764459.1 ABC transporter ATP-binding protein [Microbacterium sp. zg.B48]MCR2810933.1 ABC transporter ATP-binding protein [Microbacterium sp. zg.B185]WIM19668.1 ABC transporter ATP-binding protein [Microbacterium sp. zg-B185]
MTHDLTAEVALSAAHVGKSFGTGADRVAVIEDLHLEIRTGDITCLVGASGVGKTTLLRLLAGLATPSTGAVSLAGSVITEPVEQIAVVFQDYRGSLLPWMRVAQNVAFPLEGRKVPKAERLRRAQDALEVVGLGESADKYPWQLSGGMQQRVAIARALAYEAPIMLMDEPFGSLDAQTRFELEDLVLGLRDRLGITIVVVTHDIDEAVYLGDRVVVLGGRPSRIVDDVEVPLGRERNQLVTRATPTFVQLRTRVLEEIQEHGLVQQIAAT